MNFFYRLNEFVFVIINMISGKNGRNVLIKGSSIVMSGLKVL